MENNLARRKSWLENNGDWLKIAEGEVDSGAQYNKERS